MRQNIIRARSIAWTMAFAVLTTAATGAVAKPADDNIDITFRTLDLALTGSLAPRCQASGGGTIDFGTALGGGMEARSGFGLDCNIPFALKVTSTNGGLAHATAPQGQGPFAGTLRYTMDVRVPTETAAGQGPTVGGTFSSEAHSQTFTSGADAIAAGGGTLLIKTAAPEGAGLLAGEYSDTVTITVVAL